MNVSINDISGSSPHYYLWSQGSKSRVFFVFRSSPSEVFLGKGFSENMQQNYRRTPMPKCDFNKVAEQLY